MSAGEGIAARLLAWYDRHGRKGLPWQQQRSPYRVWVSEIMLQQTQVTTVIPYFERFMHSFPTLEALAAADEEAVLAHWSGLGYYSRARNLHATAQQALAEHNGLPEDTEALIALPGIGRSTAHAILAQAHGRCLPILDGNVKRVLARYHAEPGWPGSTAVQKRLWAHAEAHMPAERCADYTQAIMDLGAMLCRRKADCDACPLSSDCAARAQDKVADYPQPKPRKTLPERHTNMLILRDGSGRVLMERRPPSGIWGGLWSLPEYDGDELQELTTDRQPLQPFRHTFSHFHLHVQPWLIKGETPQVNDRPQRWDSPEAWLQAGIPAPIGRLLKSLA